MTGIYPYPLPTATPPERWLSALPGLYHCISATGSQPSCKRPSAAEPDDATGGDGWLLPGGRLTITVVFWLDESTTQNTYPWAQQAGLYWSDITDREGWDHRCEFKEANINIPVRYSDPDSINNIRQVLTYMDKTQQKYGLLLFRCNEVPPRSLKG